MAMNFSIVKPEAGTNLITNPSIETATTGWNASGATLAQSATWAAFGAYSLSIAPTSGTFDGAIYKSVSLTSGTTYTFSVYGKFASGKPYLIGFYDTGGSQLTVQTFTGTGSTQRINVTRTENSTATRWLYVIKNSDANTTTFYVDGAQCEAVAYATTYMDGTQPGCRWTGTPHASTSTRDAQSREGGRIYTIYQAGGTINYAKGLPAHTGLGMPPMMNVQVPNAQRGGMTHQRSLPGPRTITLQLGLDGTSLDNLHTLRQNFIDLVKPDLVFPSNQPFWLRYYNDDASSAGTVVRCKCIYESGLDWTQPKGLSVDLPLRLNAPDPYWYEEVPTAAVLGYNTSISNANSIILRDTTGAYSALGTGSGNAGAIVYALAIDPSNGLYAGGTFTSMNSVSNTKGIAKWQNGAWTAMGTGVGASTADVRNIAVGPDGTTIYAGGSAATFGGVSNTSRVAYWDGSVWNAMAHGVKDNTVFALAIDKAGNVYVGGDFTAAKDSGGSDVANTACIAKWTGSAWAALGAGGASDRVHCLACDVNGNLYAGGLFSTIGGVTCEGIAKWTGTAWVNIGNAAGGSSNVYALAFGKDGKLYAGGNFTSIGGVSANYIAQYNGTAWQPLGAGLDAPVYTIVVRPDGGLRVGGAFTHVDSIAFPDGHASWNGASWSQIDINLPSSPIVWAIAQANDHPTSPTLYMGFDARGTATGATVTTATVTNGTAEVAPYVYMVGPGAFISLANRTTGKQIQFNGLTLLAGETALLDLTPNNQRFVSSFRGSLMNYLLSAPQIADWTLLPGTNSIAAYITGGSGATNLILGWFNAHWSIDAIL